MAEPEHDSPSGMLVVDKPEGPTSHDVVARMRRGLHTRRVGHAGTLDPMATGVLVVLVGEATKLEPYLSASRKSYEAEIALGRGTDTFDRLGATIEEREVPSAIVQELGMLESLCADGPAVLDRARAGAPLVVAALERELGRELQSPPKFSAIKVAGQKGYDRARRGEEFELAPRPVRLLELEILGAGSERRTLRVALVVSKGYYVRSLARDLGDALGVPAHLTELRRTKSGHVGLDRAVTLDAPEAELRASLIAVEEAARLELDVETLTAEGVLRAERGQPLTAGDFSSRALRAGAWLAADGSLVAIGEIGADGIGRVQRGFVRRVTKKSGPSEPRDDEAG